MYRWSIESDVFLCLQQVVRGKVRFLSNVGVRWRTVQRFQRGQVPIEGIFVENKIPPGN